MVGRLTHLDDAGAARMVDVSTKEITEREAVAENIEALAEHGPFRKTSSDGEH